MKILNINSKNFEKNVDILLLKRKSKVQSNSVSVSSIIKDVRKNGDKALVKYEKKFNQNNVIVPSQKQISNSIKSLDKKVTSICKFEFVDRVKSKNIKQNDPEEKLELIGMDYLKNNDNYEINLMFTNNAYITLSTEIIEVTLDDQNKAD